MNTINMYQCRANKNHIFKKESIKEVNICPRCHHFANRLLGQEKHEDSIITAAASIITNDSMNYSSTNSSPDSSSDSSPSDSNDFSGGGGESGGAGASGEW